MVNDKCSMFKAYNDFRVTPHKDKVCYAPFQSIYFGVNGDAIACCYNRTHVLGKYPENTLIDIWTGNAAKELRGAISRYDFSKGCYNCGVQLNAGNFSGAHTYQYDEYAMSNKDYKLSKVRNYSQMGRMIHYPKMIEFELSNTCNLECVMCAGFKSSSIRKNRDKLPPLPLLYDMEFVRQLEEFLPHLEVAKFLGGEPFLIPIYYEIWDKIIDINPQIKTHITTNGTILNRRVKRVVEEIDCIVSLSIDSIVKDTYEKIRKNAKYKTVMKNLDYFIQLADKKGYGMGFSVCPIIDNWWEMPGMIEFGNKNNVYVYFNTVNFPVESSMRSLSSQQLRKILDLYQSYNMPRNNDVTIYNADNFASLTKHVEYWYKLKLEEEKAEKQVLEAPKVTYTLDYLKELLIKIVLYRELLKKDISASKLHLVAREELRRYKENTTATTFIQAYYQALLEVFPSFKNWTSEELERLPAKILRVKDFSLNQSLNIQEKLAIGMMDGNPLLAVEDIDRTPIDKMLDRLELFLGSFYTLNVE